MANSKSPAPPPPAASNTRWTPPEQSWIKMNSDAALSSSGELGTAGVFRDFRGVVLEVVSSFGIWSGDVHMAEAEACLQGVKAAKEAGFRSVIFEMDNQLVATQLQREAIPRTHLGTILCDILEYAKDFDDACFVWVPRSQNLLAHKIASFVRLQHSCVDLSIVNHAAIRDVVRAEAIISHL